MHQGQAWAAALDIIKPSGRSLQVDDPNHLAPISRTTEVPAEEVCYMCHTNSAPFPFPVG